MITQDIRQESDIRLDKNQIILEPDNIRELLVAPDIDPFSEREMEYMGQSALERVLRQLKPGWTFRAQNLRMTIRLPPDEITQGLPVQVKGAIHRFCRTKVEDNTTQLRNVRWNGIRQIPFSFVFLAVCISLGSFFGTGIITAIPKWLESALNEGFIIVGWVSLTGPAQTLLYEPIPIRRENKILCTLMDIPIEIQPRY